MSPFLGVLAVSLLLGLSPALSVAQNKCAGAKIKATCKEASCKAALEAKQAGSGGTVDAAKVAKCAAAFSKSFAKSEAKGGCATTGDAATIEGKVDAFVLDLDTELDVGTGTNPNGCEGDKIKATAKKASCKCSLEAKQASNGGTIDPAKVAKCEATFSKSFAKSEAKGGCNTTGDTVTIESKVDAFLADVDTELPTVPTADLAASQTVSNASPFYYAPVTFTTTVTNTGTTNASAGVTAVVNVPAGLISPAVTTSTGDYDVSTSTWAIGSLAKGATATLTITAFAAAVSDGAQTVTATVTAATFDPNSANNTASASETSQDPPIEAVITLDPGSFNLVNICAMPPDPVTVTLRALVLNAANPAAPPSSVGTVFYRWICDSFVGCPTPVNDITNSTFVTYTNADFMLGATYVVQLTVVPDPLSADRIPETTDVVLTTICIE
jgi:Domain of unknown function DUF11